MNNANYWRARGLAYKIAANYGFVDECVDLVHDAYLIWFNKTSKDLFNEHPGTIFHVIKNVCKTRSGITKYMVNGEFRYRSSVYIPTTDIPEEYTTGYIPSVLPTDNLSLEEIDKALKSLLDPRELRVYAYLQEGYKPSEIGARIGSYRQRVNGIIAQIRKKTRKVLSEQY